MTLQHHHMRTSLVLLVLSTLLAWAACELEQFNLRIGNDCADRGVKGMYVGSTRCAYDIQNNNCRNVAVLAELDITVPSISPWRTYGHFGYKNADDDGTCVSNVDVTGRLIHVRSKQADKRGCSEYDAGTNDSINMAAKAKKRWIALVERGRCPFTDKISLALSRGASAVLIYNCKDGKECGPGIVMTHESEYSNIH